MRAVAPIAAMAVLLTSAPGYAFDAAQVDIIGLHLGMSDSEVAVALRRQGFAVTQDQGALSARTRDGQVTVEFTESHVARRVSYTLKGYGAGEAKKIEGSVLDRFGPPSQKRPLAWCRTLGQGGTCPGTEPSLMYLPETLTLVLRSGTHSGE